MPTDKILPVTAGSRGLLRGLLSGFYLFATLNRNDCAQYLGI
ncbi:MAG: hypothetical protein CFH05_01126 [Alphaproteobacteria bacterium MarineAlpha3_Bin4]|nr:MAG: hypothetical protein CFH05_01126 [Alphaproteobacteria bacterium MarineAlpha3_Bin4]